MIDFDLNDAATRSDPFPTFARLRDESPVHRSAALGGWMLTRYADVGAALRDPRLSSDRISPFMERLGPEEQETLRDTWRSLKCWTLFSDPPEHTRLRALFTKAFNTRNVERLRASVHEIVTELLDRCEGRDDVDLVRDLAYPLPAMVICDILGLDRDDIGRIKTWSDGIEPFLGLPKKPKEAYVAVRRSVEELSEFFRAVVRDHRARPRDNLMSALVDACDGPSALTEDELVATSIMLLFAAHTTTTHLIGNGVLALVRHPAELARLRAEPDALEPAVEEMLRFDGPIQAVRRVARESFTIGDTPIAAGDIVFSMINAANRDDRQFPDPERFDIRRSGRHIAFGVGAHFCSGAQLARIEGQVAVQALLERYDRIRIGEEPLRWIESFGFRGLKALPVTLDGGDSNER